MKFKNVFRKIVSILMVSVLFVLTCTSSTSAASDVASIGKGFNVDLSMYKNVAWYNRITSKVYFSHRLYTANKRRLVGTSTTDIGMTRSKKKSGGSYFDSVMISITSKGQGSSGTYGYTDYIRLTSDLGNKKTLWNSQPENVAGSTNYTIGMSLGGNIGASSSGVSAGVSAGISASQTFTQNALTVNDYSDYNRNKFDIKFQYASAFWRWDTETFGKYAYQNSKQKAAYEIKTNDSKYSCKLIQKSSYKIWNSTPNYWANDIGNTVALVHTIYFKSPY